MLLPLVVLAQAAVPPTAADPLNALFASLGGGAGAVFIWQLARPFYEAWSTGLKRKLGDTELEAKTKTRTMIHELTDHMTKMAEHQQVIADIQRQTLKELENFRRENDMQHDHLQSLIGRLK